MQSEVIIADGKVAPQMNAKIKFFWASNGGEGSYGVVTKLISRTHKLASHFSLISGEITVRLINL